MKDVVQLISESIDIKELTFTLRQGRKEGHLNQMNKTRHYMFHRDKRKYWDDWRIDPAGNLKYQQEYAIAP